MSRRRGTVDGHDPYAASVPYPDSADEAAGLWNIAVPARPLQLPGLTMAGFDARTTALVDIEVVPHPAVTLAIDLGDEPYVIDAGDGQEQSGTIVAGITTCGARARGRDIRCLQIRLSPVLAHAVLGTALRSDDTPTSLEDLWGRDAIRFEHRLRDTSSWEERFSIVEAELALRAEVGRRVDSEVAHAWHQLVVSQGRARIDEVATELGWSRKRLWSRFRAQIGLTPKRSAQLVRFDHAAHLLAAGEAAAVVAAEAGYADQSHLHRDAMTFVGTTPSAVAHSPWLAVDDIAWA
jgi:AraC-like DNA-binding protein